MRFEVVSRGSSLGEVLIMSPAFLRFVRHSALNMLSVVNL